MEENKDILIGALRGRNPDNPSERKPSEGRYTQHLEINQQGTSNTLTGVQKDNLVVEPTTICLNSKVDGRQPSVADRIYDSNGVSVAVTSGWIQNITEPQVMQVGNIVDDSNREFKNPQTGRIYSDEGLCPTLNTCQGGSREPKILAIPDATTKGYAEVAEGGCFDAAYPNSATRRGRVQEQGKVTPALCTSNEVCYYESAEPQFRIRKLTPRECFRLMGVRDYNIDKIQDAGISNSQQYKLAGNSIVVDTLFHLFRKLLIETDTQEQPQLTLF